MVGPVVKERFKLVKLRVPYGCRLNQLYGRTVAVIPPDGYFIGRTKGFFTMNLSGLWVEAALHRKGEGKMTVPFKYLKARVPLMAKVSQGHLSSVDGAALVDVTAMRGKKLSVRLSPTKRDVGSIKNVILSREFLSKRYEILSE